MQKPANYFMVFLKNRNKPQILMGHAAFCCLHGFLIKCKPNTGANSGRFKYRFFYNVQLGFPVQG
jgi:hypothetical protein